MGLLDPIKAMKPQHAMAVGLVIGLAYYLLFKYDSGQKEKKQILHVNGQLVALEKELKELEKVVEAAKQLQQQKAELGEDIDRALEYVPDNLTHIEITRSLSEAAQAVNVKIGYRSGGIREKKEEFYDEISVDVDILGTFGQVVTFLSELTKVGKIYTVDKMNFSVQSTNRQDDEIKVKFGTTVVGYRYNATKLDEGGQ